MFSINPKTRMPLDRDGGPTEPSTAVGLHLLPSDLLCSILLGLPLPDLLRLRSVSTSLLSLISAPDFRRIYNSTPAASRSPWLFLFKKRPPRSSLLLAFDPRSHRWFRLLPVALLIETAVPPGEDLYFLASAGEFFLFASNGALRQLVAVDLSTRSVVMIPHSPLGPRGTSSWRRSGLKLVSDGPGRFRFMFAELLGDRPMLFEYRSDIDSWRLVEPACGKEAAERQRHKGVCLNAGRHGNETILLSTDGPVVHRPRFRDGHVESTDRLHFYGDGNMAVVRSTGEIGSGGAHMRVLKGIEIWGLGLDGEEWELVGRVDGEMIEGIRRKPYGVMVGCLEERDGVIRLVLMSNLKGIWDLMWLNLDRVRRHWEWVPIPDFGAQGLNMAGIALSSTFVGFRAC